MSEVSTAELKHAVKAQRAARPRLSNWSRSMSAMMASRSGSGRAEGSADERLALWCCLSLHSQMQGMQRAAPEMTAPQALVL